jgi:hypothetical protein
MEEVKFKIGTEEFIIKQSFRAWLLFEEMTGRVYEKDEKLGTQLKMFFCMLKAGNQEKFRYTFDEFIDLLDKYPGAMNIFYEYLKKLAEPNGDKKKLRGKR